jgi:hypothetical protein
MRFFSVVGVILGFSTLAHAQTRVADYGAAFPSDPSGTLATGWHYYWNPTNAPIGTASGYVPLTYIPSLTRFETAGGATNTYPDPAPGSNLFIDNDTVYPGQAQSQAADGIEHYAIIAYTIQAADMTAAGATTTATATLDSYHFNIGSGGDGINARLYINDTPAPGRPLQPLPPDFVFDSSDPFLGGPFPIGDVQAGDTIYIAIGASGPTFFGSGGTVPANDTADTLGLSFTIALSPTPEPATVSVIGMGIVCAAMTRRRRARDSASRS